MQARPALGTPARSTNSTRYRYETAESGRSAGSGRESQPASDAEKALFGDGQATSTMKTTYVNVVALYVPPANSDAKITAVGSERQPVRVEAL